MTLDLSHKATEQTGDGIALQSQEHDRRTALGASLFLAGMFPEIDKETEERLIPYVQEQFIKTHSTGYEEGRIAGIRHCIDKLEKTISEAKKSTE